jgi:tetratricopeptide (TPR) repeat protein
MFRLCLTVLLAAGLAGAPGAARWVPPGQVNARDPDRLFDAREDLPSALAASDEWAARLAKDTKDYQAAWKLARAAYWLGSHVPAPDRRAQYERGLEAGRRAVELEPDRPEGHFWLAATMGAMAESFGLRAGLQYRGPVKREFEAVLRIDPAYSDGGADRGLGRWHFRVPWLFGGRKDKAVEHLQRSLTYDPANAASRFFLAEAYLAMDRDEDGRRELELVLEAPETIEWGPEVREFKRKALAMLERLRQP